jgi:hypothetical protein
VNHAHTRQEGSQADVTAAVAVATGRSHPNAPLTAHGRRRLCERIDAGRPISHVAAEAGVSRRCLGKLLAKLFLRSIADNSPRT